MGDYPWQYCSVKGCLSRTQKYPPGQGFICGKCYKKAPAHLRKRRARLGRQMGRARSPERKIELEILRGRCVDLMIDKLNDRGSDDRMPPAMQEQLRKDGLL